METINQNPLLNYANIIRSEYSQNYLIELLSITAIVKYLSPNSTFDNIDDFNEIIARYYPELMHEADLSAKHISELIDANVSPEEICDFLFTLVSNPSRYNSFFDISTEYARELSKLIKLPVHGDIAALNCTAISILKEAIKQNKFKGTIHLFSLSKDNLRLGFLRIYPLNQNIILHLDSPDRESFVASNLNYFDFMYSMPPIGVGHNDPIDRYISSSQQMLKENGTLFLLTTSSLLSLKSKQKTREQIIKLFDIDLIFNLAQAFKPFSGIDSAILLLRKASNEINDIFIAHLNFLDESLEDLKYVVEKYYDFKLGEDTKSVSPVINHISKDKIGMDLNIMRFNPKLQTIRKKLIEKYELVKLNELCEVIPSKARYSSKDYQKRPSDDTFRYIRITDIKDGIIDTSTVKWVNRKSSYDIQTKIGDLIFSTTGNVGKVGFVDENSANSLVSNSLVILRPYERIIDRDYLYLALQSEYSTNQILGNVVGTTISHLPISSIKSLEIPYLSFEKQRRSVKHIVELQSELSELKKRVEQLESELKFEINNLFD
jgi:hypothetical protein